MVRWFEGAAGCLPNRRTTAPSSAGVHWLAPCVAASLLFAAPARGQEPPQGGQSVRKQATAVRIAPGAIRLDGILDDAVWLQAPAIRDFVQKEPQEGAPPAEATEVRFAWDDTALYVGARMESRQPSAIQAPMGRRDSVDAQSEHILVSLDTFLDRRTAYTFGVTASGVRLDYLHPQDDETVIDTGFEPVWRARTHVDDRGWSAELWIPFSQLRFNDVAEQVWGLNVRRFTPTREEQDYWVVVPRTVRGWSSHFGELRGITDLGPRRRLELLPFLAASALVNGNRDPRNPFDAGRTLGSRAGMDLKVGLGPNLTLDATFNPDFGQVEADPAEVNLTAYETRFTEKRPFFVEGSQVLNGIQANQFYSRRIGARPTAPAAGEYVAYPPTTTILGAGKLTGRLRSGTSIGALGAITGEEWARTVLAAGADIRRVPVAPRTAYALMRVQQEFGRSHSTASVMVTGVHRWLAADDPLVTLLVRDALSAGGDAVLRFREGEYELKGTAVGSIVAGEPAAVEIVQRSSAHYAQRPDRHYARFDPARTSMAGYSASLYLSRLSGTHWLWSTGTKVDSPGFETNDIGNLRGADSFEPASELQFRETRPGRVLRAYAVGIGHSGEWNWRGDRERSVVRPFANLTWWNFWTTAIAVSRVQPGQSWTLTRGGPVMDTPGGWTTELGVANSARARTRWSGAATIGSDEDGGLTRKVTAMLSVRPSPAVGLSVTPLYERLIQTQQYVTSMAGGARATFGRRYVFGRIDRTTLSAQLRLTMTWTPDVNLDLYAEPFAASGSFSDLGELAAPGTRRRVAYGTRGTTLTRLPGGGSLVTDGPASFTLPNGDFNLRSFRGNVVLRWEWRPGSTVYVVWQQDRLARDPVGTVVGARDVFRAMTAPGSQVLLVKTSFWLARR